MTSISRHGVNVAEPTKTDPAEIIRAAMIITGTAATAYGAWLIHPAAGFIVGGAILLAVGLIGALRAGA